MANQRHIVRITPMIVKRSPTHRAQWRRWWSHIVDRGELRVEQQRIILIIQRILATGDVTGRRKGTPSRRIGVTVRCPQRGGAILIIGTYAADPVHQRME
jgi:hypothetical protein